MDPELERNTPTAGRFSCGQDDLLENIIEAPVLPKGKVLFRHSSSFHRSILQGRMQIFGVACFEKPRGISILPHGRSFVRKYIASQINNRHVRVLVKGFAPRSLGMAGINYPQLGFTMNCRWSEEQGTKQCKLLKILQFSRVSKHILRILDGLLRLRRSWEITPGFYPAPTPLRLMASIAHLSHTPKLELCLFGKGHPQI